MEPYGTIPLEGIKLNVTSTIKHMPEVEIKVEPLKNRVTIKQIPAKDIRGNGVQCHLLAKYISTQLWHTHNNQPKDPNNRTDN